MNVGVNALTIRQPYDNSVVAEVPIPTSEHIEATVEAAVTAASLLRTLPASVRASALDHVSRRLWERREEAAHTICAEAGKPMMWARIEVTRAISTFRWAAEEARRFGGEMQRLDTDSSSHGRVAFVRRFARGPVLGITPFNFPLNLVAHKLAPAVAVGAPILIKPAPRTPLSALLLAELLAETDLPEGAFAVLPVPNEMAPGLVADPRLSTVSFTGSVPVGWGIRRAAPEKHVTLELGGDAAVIVTADWPESKRDVAAQRIALCGHGAAGQSCIAVQRVLLAEEVYDDMTQRIVDATESLVTGDPREESVQVGPMIDDASAQRTEAWIEEAVAGGATLLTGSSRQGTTFPPAVLGNVPSNCALATEEVFAPVLSIDSFRSLEEAFEKVNRSKFGLQAGIYTQDIQTAFAATARLEVGGVIIGDVPTYRADHMPYGGVKASGTGREGVRSAMDDYSEPKVMVLTDVAL